MIMTNLNNNKEFFELLADTDSNTGSEVQKLVIPPRKKRFRRRLRNNPNTRHEGTVECPCPTHIVSVVIFRIVLVTWLVTLTWLGVVLYKEILTLNSEVRQVVAAHQGVPDALQECHSLSRELQKNQSLIMEKLAGFSLLLGNFSSNMSDMRGALALVQQQLKASPSLLNDPRLIKDLPESVAKFGSKIQDLQATATALKEQDSRLDSLLTGLTTNLTDLRAQVSDLSQTRDGVSAKELSDEKSALMAVIGQISANVTNLNLTLSNKLKWTADDQHKDHEVLESLREMNQNVTARLKTVEGQLIKESTPSAPIMFPDSAPPTKQNPTSQTSSLYSSLDRTAENKNSAAPPIITPTQ